MDLIASHRQGLIDQLEAETAALAGRAGDHLQRAMVLHHLYDHSRATHGWALVEAAAALRTVKGLKRLEARLDGWTWRGAKRADARAALDQLRNALGDAARARCAAAYRAYRLTATPALAEEVEALLPDDLAGALGQVHSARRASDPVGAIARRRLAVLTEREASGAVDQAALDGGWAAVSATVIGKAAARLLPPIDALAGFDGAERAGWIKAEARIVGAVELPARFRANPAQHFYAMLRDIEERRRKEWRGALDLDPCAVELAA